MKFLAPETGSSHSGEANSSNTRKAGSHAGLRVKLPGIRSQHFFPPIRWLVQLCCYLLPHLQNGDNTLTWRSSHSPSHLCRCTQAPPSPSLLPSPVPVHHLHTWSCSNAFRSSSLHSPRRTLSRGSTLSCSEQWLPILQGSRTMLPVWWHLQHPAYYPPPQEQVTAVGNK